MDNISLYLIPFLSGMLGYVVAAGLSTAVYSYLRTRLVEKATKKVIDDIQAMLLKKEQDDKQVKENIH